MTIKEADVKRKKHLKILLYGDASTGKTHLALKATPHKTLIFDAESGADFFEGREGFYFDYWLDDKGLKTASVDELRKAISYLGTDDGRKKYDTFIIDPISDIWDNIQFERGEYKDIVATRKGKQRQAINVTDLESFNQKDWNDMKRVYKKIMLDLKNLPQNIFLVAREKEISETKPDGTIIRTGEYTFDAEKNTKYAVDFSIRLVLDFKTNKRYAFVSKTCSEGLETGQKIENPSFELFNSVVNLMVGGKETVSLNDTKENIFDQGETEADKIQRGHEEIVELCTELGGSKNENLMTILKKYEKSGNPNKIKDFEQLTKLHNELIQLKGDK